MGQAWEALGSTGVVVQLGGQEGLDELGETVTSANVILGVVVVQSLVIALVGLACCATGL